LDFIFFNMAEKTPTAAEGQHAENPLGHPETNEEVAGWVNLTVEARNATEKEHQLTWIKAVKLYPKACFWSAVVSLVVIMDGYDTALIGSLFGFPAFQKRFGSEVNNTGKYQVSAKWQDALGLASPLGNVVGIFINGVMTERFGHKKTLLGAIIWLTGCILIAFFAPNVQVLFVGELLCGLSWGVFTTMAPAFASEVTPLVLRGYLETFVVLCWGIGQLISYGVLDGLIESGASLTNYAWRIPFAVQWVWPVIIIPLVIFCPESPWWFVRKGRIADAEKSINRLSTRDDPNAARDAVALMVETTELERSMTEGASYIDCLRRDNLWRTEIGCVAWLSQVLVGFALSSYATYFYEQAGLSAKNSYKMTVGQGGLHFACTLVSVFITGHVGRRKIFIYGCAAMGTIMCIIGFIALAKESTATGWASSVMYLTWFSIYELTIGPVAFIIVGETSSTRLRSKSIALGRNAYNVFSIISFTCAPYVLNPTEGNWKGKSGFLAGGLCFVCMVWAIFRLPECKDRTYEELDIMFARKLKAWEFQSYVIDHQIDIERKMNVEHHE
jgi:SP family general alpha glucoside:H+ symporter-like MFS transporter